jgi:hypothetical protein
VKEMKKRSCSFLIRVSPGPNNALLSGLLWANTVER